MTTVWYQIWRVSILSLERVPWPKIWLLPTRKIVCPICSVYDYDVHSTAGLEKLIQVTVAKNARKQYGSIQNTRGFLAACMDQQRRQQRARRLCLLHKASAEIWMRFAQHLSHAVIFCKLILCVGIDKNVFSACVCVPFYLFRLIYLFVLRLFFCFCMVSSIST